MVVEAGEAAVLRITKVKTAIGAIIRLTAMTNQNLNHHGETIWTMSPPTCDIWVQSIIA